MQLYTLIPFQRWVLGTLVVIWLLMGGLVLAEQLNVVTETGSHDEQALEHLQLAVRSETLDDSTGALPPDLLQLSVAVCLVRIGTLVASNPTCSLLGSPHTRSLVLLTCCYRI
ncbi:MAG: hypothetical protein UZ03_NOB001002738 [Nitrospira sp. OLB3]|nr:MAG: hypothetical protein UZ03_NOB001002738 [Nitrospira sp. OLB3]